MERSSSTSEDDRPVRFVSESRRRAINTDFRGMLSQGKEWVINPEESPLLRHWDLVTTSCLLFVCFVSPYEVAFQKQVTQVDFMFVVNRMVDLIFTVDMCLQFFIMYPVVYSHGTVYIGEHRLIIKRYVKTWFFVDLIAILPFDIIALVFQSRALSRLSLLRVVRLIRLLKLVRLLRGMRIIKRWEVEVGFSYRKITLMTLVVIVIVAWHWVACTLGIVNTFQGEFCGGPDEPEGCVRTWFTAHAMDMTQMGVEIVHWRVFIVAIYTAATYIVHPVTGAPTGDGERILFTLLIFVGGVIWTRVISSSVAVTTSMNRHSNAYHSLMDDLNATADELKLPHDIKRRLRKYFMRTAKSAQRAVWDDIVRRMSPKLQTRVSFHVHKDWLARVCYLRRAPKLFTAHLTLGLEHETYAAQETFGDVFKLYVVRVGVCSRSGHVSLMVQGNVWGDEHLLLSCAELLTPNVACAMTFMEVFVLTRDHFCDVLDEFPELQPQIRRFVVWYALVRGVIVESKKRRLAKAETVRLSEESQSFMMSNSHMSDMSQGADASHEDHGHIEHHEMVRQTRRNRNILRDSPWSPTRVSIRPNVAEKNWESPSRSDANAISAASNDASDSSLAKVEGRIMEAIRYQNEIELLHRVQVLNCLDVLQHRVEALESLWCGSSMRESTMPRTAPNLDAGSHEASMKVSLPRDSWDIHKFSKAPPSWNLPPRLPKVSSIVEDAE